MEKKDKTLLEERFAQDRKGKYIVYYRESINTGVCPEAYEYGIKLNENRLFWMNRTQADNLHRKLGRILKLTEENYISEN